MVFNLYETSKKEYLGTFTNANDNYQLEEFIPSISEDEQSKFDEEEKRDKSTFYDSYGNKLIYSGKKQFTFIDTKNKSYTNEGKLIYNPSLLEIKQKQLKSRIQSYEKLKELGAPECILNDAKKNILNIRDDIFNISGEDRNSLEDIKLIISDGSEVDTQGR